MESLAYIHLTLAYEDPTPLELSNIEVFDLLTKLNLLILLKQQKRICKAWLYGLSLSLTFIPLSNTLALHLGESGERVSSFASKPNSKMMPELPNSSSLNGNGETQSYSIPSSSIKEKHQKVLFAKEDEEKVNSINLLDTSTNIQTVTTTQFIQNAENKLPVSNLNSKAESTQIARNTLPISESKSSSKTELEAKTEPEQQGKLRFVNDTPYIGVVVLYKPGEKHPYRYAHIPPCHKKELLATYSNLWQVSFNNHAVASVGKVSVKDGSFFEIKTSRLTGKQSLVNSCFEASKSQPVITQERKPVSDYLGEYKDIKKKIQYNENIPISLYQSYTNQMQNLINEIFSYKNYWSKSNDRTDYCELEELLKEMRNFYNYSNENGLKLDGRGDSVEVEFILNNSTSISKTTQNDNRTKRELKDLLGYLEVYLLTYFTFYDSLSAEPNFILQYSNVNNSSRKAVKSVYSPPENIISNSCEIRVKNGSLLVSNPRRKAKIC